MPFFRAAGAHRLHPVNVMGVPITWIDMYNPDQFEIVELSEYTKTQGMSKESVDAYYASGQTGQISAGQHRRAKRQGKLISAYYSRH
ncbi:adenine-specific methyltransferase EcoRI family protein [Arthrobacter sp. ISL-30]|uniref:adenine-specific methyltransferase EcoRI family protein n=1 Tax=Arthrobacter sp. ISL-30 TaxID=2819109 RepID=UPI0027DECC5A|nr:adenine-specific methyltransferase EcoRI family protein [Arthrobacter sp. ISL-30]